MNAIRRVVVVGGGTAGWMSASALASVLGSRIQIELVESDEIGIVGVGEATIPPIRQFNAALKLDEDEFLRRCQGSFKLGIEFVNWGAVGERYVHGFGTIGHEYYGTPFHHFWLKRRQEGRPSDLGRCSINTTAPLQAKFMRPRVEMKGSPLADISYAFHFDAQLYARFLREFGERHGVRRTEGKIVDVRRREGDGARGAVREAEAAGRRARADVRPRDDPPLRR